MLAQLGEIVFELLKEPVTLSGSKKWQYAEHPVVWEKTKLQYTGFEPREFDMSIRFHASFCDPKEELERLESQTARSFGAEGNIESGEFLETLPFILGDGTVLGEYVITEISQQHVKFFPDGRMLEVMAGLKIREFL